MATGKDKGGAREGTVSITDHVRWSSAALRAALTTSTG